MGTLPGMRRRRSRALRAPAARLAPAIAFAGFLFFAFSVFFAFFASSAISAAPVAVAVDPNADRHPVSPLIYGMNFGTAAQMSRLKVPVRRWGGNSTTRYNWENDTHNSANDWFFFNYAGNANPANLPNGSDADVFVDEIRAAGGEALVTVPLIGWTPIDRTRRWGFSVAKYGAQKVDRVLGDRERVLVQPRRRKRREAGRHVRDGQRPGRHVEDDRRDVRHALDGPPRGPDRNRGGRRRPPLGARQRADALELDAPRRPPGGDDVRRALGEDRDDRRRDQGAGPRRADPGPGGVGVVRVLLFRRGRLRTRSRPRRARRRGLPPVVPRPGEGVGDGARQEAPRLLSTSTTTRRPPASRSRPTSRPRRPRSGSGRSRASTTRRTSTSRGSGRTSARPCT